MDSTVATVGQNDAWHREQRRLSQDLIRVFNPMERDYILIWDDQRFVVPGKTHDKGWGLGMRVMQRYLAKKYTKEIVDKMLTDNADELLRMKKEKLMERGDENPTYNANSQMQFSGRTDDPKTREPLEDLVWMGIEEEFGVDAESVEIKSDEPMEQKDTLDRLKDKKYIPEGLRTPQVITETPPVYVSKRDQAQKEAK